MTPAAERRAKIDDRVAKLVGIIRRSLTEPAETVLTTLERIRVQDYPAHAADHAIAQLAELASEIDGRLGDEARMIARLRNGLDHFERRLIAMSREDGR